MILTPDNLIWLREKNCVLLDGAFDPLHSGHVAYFTAAIEAFPSHLKICAVASDDDIRAKGREPLFDQATRVKVVQAAMGGGYAIAKDGPTEHLISRLKPAAYVKGADWQDRLPAEQLAACALNDVQIVYLNTVTDSSSKALRQWALREAERGLDRLETFMAGQAPASAPWQPVTDYSFEARKAIEGPHAELIVSLCDDSGDILDYGCGPRGHLVRMMLEEPATSNRQIGVVGYDPQAPLETPWHPAARVNFTREIPRSIRAFEVVVCREVLEHCTVSDVVEVVRNLFRLSSRYVYITTRFNEQGVFEATTDLLTDPTHITCLSQPFLRSLCVLNGGKRRRDLETTLDHMNKGRVLVYEVTR